MGTTGTATAVTVQTNWEEASVIAFNSGGAEKMVASTLFAQFRIQEHTFH
jgi:hypothetical protein